MRIIGQIVLNCVCIILLSATAYAADYALVAGIGDYIDDGPMKRMTTDLEPMSSNSAKAMAVLFEDMGIRKNDMRVLLDHAATKQAILDGLDWLARVADDESTVFFYFAGHGITGLNDYDGDEPDGYDEGLCPADSINANNFFGGYEYDPSIKAAVDASFLYDDEINLKLAAIADKAMTVIAMFEACHSGGASKAIGMTDSHANVLYGSYNLAMENQAASLPFTDSNIAGLIAPDISMASGQAMPLPPQGIAETSVKDNWGIGDNVYYEGQSGIDNLIVLAACEPTQLCKYVFEYGHGIFSYAVINTIYNDHQLADYDQNGILTWYEVGTYVSSWVGAEMERMADRDIPAGNYEERLMMLQYPVLYNAGYAGANSVPSSAVGKGRQIREVLGCELNEEFNQLMQSGGAPTAATGQGYGSQGQVSVEMQSFITGYLANDLRTGADFYQKNPEQKNMLFLMHRAALLYDMVYGYSFDSNEFDQMFSLITASDPKKGAKSCRQLADQAEEYIRNGYGENYLYYFAIGVNYSDLEFAIWNNTRYNALAANGKYVNYSLPYAHLKYEYEPDLDFAWEMTQSLCGSKTKLTQLMVMYSLFSNAVSQRFGLMPADSWCMF